MQHECGVSVDVIKKTHEQNIIKCANNGRCRAFSPCRCLSEEAQRHYLKSCPPLMLLGGNKNSHGDVEREREGGGGGRERREEKLFHLRES